MKTALRLSALLAVLAVPALAQQADQPYTLTRSPQNPDEAIRAPLESTRVLEQLGISPTAIPTAEEAAKSLQNFIASPTEVIGTSQNGNQPTLEERLPSSYFREGDNNFFTFNIENDSWAGGNTDSNYTNGVRLSWFNFENRPGRIARFLGDWVPGFDVNETTGVTYSVGQNLYTPKDILPNTPQPNDRPYAGYLYGAVGYTSMAGNHIDELEASLGVVGPMAGGAWVQKNWHSFVDARNPNGWKYQLENEPALLLTYQRRFPEYWGWASDDWFLAVDPYAGYALGNVYTYGNGGVVARFGPASARYQSPPARVRPGLVGTGSFSPPPSGINWYLFAGTEARAVAHNIFLDGNTFADSYSVDKNPLVADVNAGLAITIGKVRVAYTAVYRTNEFKNQPDNGIFTAINVGYRF